MDEPEQDTDVALLLHRAAAEAPADLDAAPVVSGALRRGQQLRRRRAGAQWVGVLTIAASVATGLVVVHEWAQQAPRDSVVLAPTAPASDTASDTASATASPSVITPVSPAPRGHRSVVAVYTEVLKLYGAVGDVTSYPYGFAGNRMAQGSLNDAAGPGAVDVQVMRHTTTADETIGCTLDGTAVRSCQPLPPETTTCPEGLRCLSPADGVVDACPPAAERTPGLQACEMLADGTVVMAQTSKTYSDQRDHGEYVNEATAYRPDGLQVHASAYNGPGEKLGATRTAPALTLAELRAIATDPAWAGVDLGN